MSARRFILIMSALVALALSSATAQEGCYTNPLLSGGADPWVLLHEGSYYYMQTNAGRLVLFRTDDITDLRNARKETVWIPTDPSNAKDLWAPEIHHIDGKWYIYYAADDGNTDNHQIYVLENDSRSPFDGNFEMKGRISTDNDNNWAIDASVFEHNGELYMVWSGWQYRRVDVETQCIYIARMSDPWTLSSERVLISKPDLAWERIYKNANNTQPKHIIYVNEGPQPLKSPDGRYIHIVYSASGCWTPHYALGLLTALSCDNLLDAGSWQKSAVPVFAQSPENGVFSTGHNCFTTSPDGSEYYILYHARNMDDTIPRKTKNPRSPRLQRFTWKDGMPCFGVPEPLSAQLPRPSDTIIKPKR